MNGEALHHRGFSFEKAGHCFPLTYSNADEGYTQINYFHQLNLFLVTQHLQHWSLDSSFQRETTSL